MNEHIPAEQNNPEVCGHQVNGKLYWKIGEEDVSDEHLRQWIRENLDACWKSTDGGIVSYHTRAYANRRRAIGNFMRTLKWT
jgi:hypothetical protein